MTVESIDRTDPGFARLTLRGPAPDFARHSARVVEGTPPIALGDSVVVSGDVALWTPRRPPGEPAADPVPLALAP